jgi:hypothetical protein
VRLVQRIDDIGTDAFGRLAAQCTTRSSRSCSAVSLWLSRSAGMSSSAVLALVIKFTI